MEGFRDGIYPHHIHVKGSALLQVVYGNGYMIQHRAFLLCMSG
jgi:hypothetical protein